MMRFAAALLILLLTRPAFAEQPMPDPGYRYRVTGVGAGDVLNVRSQPGTAGEVFGTLVPGAGNLVVTGVRQTINGSAWWEIAHKSDGTTTGWVNARFLEAERRRATSDGREATVGPDANFPLACAGTEPFWGLRIDGGEAHFSSPGADGTEKRIWRTSGWRSAAGRPQAWAFGIGLEDKGLPSPGWAAVQRSWGYCTDGMSDNEYPYSVMMITPAGKALAGCCRRAP